MIASFVFGGAEWRVARQFKPTRGPARRRRGPRARFVGRRTIAGRVGSSALAANSPSGPDARFGIRRRFSVRRSRCSPSPRPRASKGGSRRARDRAHLRVASLLRSDRRSDGRLPDSATRPGRGDPARAAPMARPRERSVASDDDKFTVVLNTFRAWTCSSGPSDTTRRAPTTSPRFACSGPSRSPSPSATVPTAPTLRPPHRRCGRRDPTTSIQNRFDVRDITTTAAFHVDDDVVSSARRSRGPTRRGSPTATPPPKFSPERIWTRCKHEYVWATSVTLGGAFSVVLTKAAFTRTEYLRLYADHLPRRRGGTGRAKTARTSPCPWRPRRRRGARLRPRPAAVLVG